MAVLLYRWSALLLFSLSNLWAGHPVYVSVTEIEYNPGGRALEISCKVFTDDFEKCLRKKYAGKIDLLNRQYTSVMNPLVSAYMQQHLRVNANGKDVFLRFMGYEQQEEGIVGFFQADNLAFVRKLVVTDNILYDCQPAQMGIIHVTVDGNRKSYRLNNPDAIAVFNF